MHRRAVDRYGLPLKHFFIWSDDIDYTGRILRREPGYLVPTSVVVHKTEAAHTAMTSAPDRFYFHVRNTLFIIRGPGRSPRDRLVFLWLLLWSTHGVPDAASAPGERRGHPARGARRASPGRRQPRLTRRSRSSAIASSAKRNTNHGLSPNSMASPSSSLIRLAGSRPSSRGRASATLP